MFSQLLQYAYSGAMVTCSPVSVAFVLDMKYLADLSCQALQSSGEMRLNFNGSLFFATISNMAYSSIQLLGGNRKKSTSHRMCTVTSRSKLLPSPKLATLGSPAACSIHRDSSPWARRHPPVWHRLQKCTTPRGPVESCAARSVLLSDCP